MSDRIVGRRPPEQAHPIRRPRTGILVGLAVLALVAPPAGVAGFFALAAFSGCFLGCAEPDRAVGAFWAAIAVLLLALPVAAGLIAARVHSLRGWLLASGGAAACLIIWQVSQKVM